MSVKMYQYAKCSTCRDAMKQLDALGVEYEAIPIFETPPTAAELRTIAELSGEPVKKLFNVSGLVYKEMNLKDKLPHMSEEEQLELLASNGRLIKRPLATDGVKATIGYKPDLYERVWGRS